MKQKNDVCVFKTGIIFKLEFIRFYLFTILSLPLLFVSINLFFFIITLLFLATIIMIRRISFFESRIEVYFYFLCKKQKINYSDIKVIIYKYGQYGGFPVVIIERKMKGWKSALSSFFLCRFVIDNNTKLLNLLFFLKRKKINLNINSDSNSKFELEKLLKDYDC